MRAGRTPRVALLGGLLALAVGSTAAAAGPGSGDRAKAHRLNVEAQALDTKAHHALLEVYALDERLAGAQQQLGSLEARSAVLRARAEVLTRQLTAARTTLSVSQRELGLPLRSLYETGSPDPLAVVLGATSLQDALAKLDTLARIADQNQQVVAVTLSAQTRLARVRERLAAQRRRVGGALDAAVAAQRRLASARSSRLAYVGSLRSQAQLKQTQIGDLLAAARASELKSQQIASRASQDPAPAPAGSPAPAPAPAAAPAAVQQPASGGGRTLTVSATGYSLPGRTATGLPVGWGVVAVDPSVIPLGTKLTIPGYGEGVAADVGSAVRGADIDLWFPTVAQAEAWGRRTVTVTLH